MSSKTGHGRGVLIPSALFVAALLVLIQFTTLERVKHILLGDPEARAQQLRLSEVASALLQALQPTDWLLAALLVSIFGFLIFHEVRRGRLSEELAHVLSDGRRTVILLAVIAVAASRFYIAPGEFSSGDSSLHLSRVWAASESFAEGHWPSWTFYSYGGFPLLQFYGPLFFILNGGIALLTGNIPWVVKISLFALHAGSAFPMYAWMRSAHLPRGAALLGGTAYVLSFQHTHTVLWTGALPVSLIYFFFPALLLGMEKVLAHHGSPRWILMAAGATAGMVLSHHGYAAWALQLAVLYLLARWILSSPRPGFAGVLKAALGLSGGLLACSGFLWPLLAEGKWVYQPTGLPLLLPGVPPGSVLEKALLWRNLWSGWTVAYMGVTVVAFAVIGAVIGWIRRGESVAHNVLAVASVVALVSIPFLAQTGRMANLLLPFLAFLCGGVVLLGRRVRPGRLALVALALMLVDLGPTTIQAAFRPERDFLRGGMKDAARVVNPHRTLTGHFTQGDTKYFNWQRGQGTGLILPGGGYVQGAPRSLNGITALVDELNAAGDTLSGLQMDMLYLWDVGGLFVASREGLITPVWGEPAAPGTSLLRPVSPILYAPYVAVAVDDTLSRLDEVPLLDRYKTAGTGPRASYRRRMIRWVGGMGIDRDARRAEMIFVTADEVARLAARGEARIETPHRFTSPPDPESLRRRGPEVSLKNSEYDVEMRKVRITYTLAHPSNPDSPGGKYYRDLRFGYLRLAFSWYPSLRVLVDGSPVTPARSLFGAIIVPAMGGTHIIELIPTQTRGRRAWTLAGLGVFALLGLGCLISGRRKP